MVIVDEGSEPKALWGRGCQDGLQEVLGASWKKRGNERSGDPCGLGGVSEARPCCGHQLGHWVRISSWVVTFLGCLGREVGLVLLPITPLSVHCLLIRRLFAVVELTAYSPSRSMVEAVHSHVIAQRICDFLTQGGTCTWLPKRYQAEQDLPRLGPPRRLRTGLALVTHSTGKPAKW